MESTGSMKEQAKQAVQEGSQRMHEGIDRLSDAAQPAMDKLSDTAQGAMDRMSGMASRMSDTWSDASSRYMDMQSQVLADTRQRIREKPIAALAIAAAAGFLLRQIMRGRSRY